MRRRDVLKGFVMVPLGLPFGGSFKAIEPAIGIGSAVLSKSRAYGDAGGKVIYTPGTVVHIATNPDHPYGESKYLVEYISEGQTFHGYSPINKLTLMDQRPRVVTGPK